MNGTAGGNSGNPFSSIIGLGISAFPTPPTVTTTTTMPAKKYDFKMGDKVLYQKTEICFFVEPRLIEREIGKGGWPRDMSVPQEYASRASNCFWYIGGDEELELLEPKKPKEVVFDLSALNPLVVTPEVREEIEAVLKQKKNSGKMFDEWGLGEVIKYGKGMTFLFYGPPGTGKTWAAHCISKVVGAELLSIGAAEIQTSEPGGANRNIKEAFEKAKEDDAVLFIDECDSLITSRNDVGMVIGGEINTLLTEIEKAEGIVILATNRIENLDEALERRISLIVEFPEPDFEQRKQIWERLLPQKLPLDRKITAARLAEYKLTGGQIKNVLVQAARLALSDESDRVMPIHMETAVARIHKSKSLMGNASRYKQIRVREDYSRG